MIDHEKIRNMTAQEMAKFLHGMGLCGTYTCKECRARFIYKPGIYFRKKIEEIIEVLNEDVKERNIHRKKLSIR